MRRATFVVLAVAIESAHADVLPPREHACRRREPGDACIDLDGEEGTCQYGCCGREQKGRPDERRRTGERRLSSCRLCLHADPPRLVPRDCSSEPQIDPEPRTRAKKATMDDARAALLGKKREAGDRCNLETSRGIGRYVAVHEPALTDGPKYWVPGSLECLPDPPRLCGGKASVGKTCDREWEEGVCKAARCAAAEGPDDKPPPDVHDCAVCAELEDDADELDTASAPITRGGRRGTGSASDSAPRKRDRTSAAGKADAPVAQPPPPPPAPTAESRGCGGCSLARGALPVGNWLPLALALALVARRMRRRRA